MLAQFMRFFTVTEQLQAQNPTPQREELLWQLRPLHDHLVQGVPLDMDNLDAAQLDVLAIMAKINTGSLGTPAARALREQSSPTAVADVLARAAQIGQAARCKSLVAEAEKVATESTDWAAAHERLQEIRDELTSLEAGGRDSARLWRRLEQADRTLEQRHEHVMEAVQPSTQLPGLGDKLVHALDDVVDLDARLGHIIGAPAPAATRAGHPAAAGGLSGFANDFAARPPHERLAARAWIQLPALHVLRSSAHLVIVALDLAGARAREFTYDRVFNRGLYRARYRASNFNRAVDVNLARARDVNLVRARDLARALTRALDLGLALDLARDCDCDYDLNRGLILALAFDRARVLDLVRVLDHTVDHTRDRDRILALIAGRDLGRDLARVLTSISRTSLGREVVDAVDHLDEALTSMADADLTRVNLRRIPLEGVRWSHATRWPPGWEDRIRHDSILIEPGLYEIRPGGRAGAKADSPANTPA
ncbi:DUF349 domain-containing protein [Kutzneria buriramensis]|uniref:DUF349 domain-containing protein n=1 Tax=Kutzneria buriramensis TaxID=1045776 RepID=UPI001476DF5B|nr:DUF349 domain-containing protein [Kutzneria buriramensis]